MADFRENPSARPMGVELELALYDTHKRVPDQERYKLASRHDLYHAPIKDVVSEVSPGDPSSVHAFLSNGYRWYQDVNQNAEIATPECAGFDELTLYAVASDYFVIEALGNFSKAGRIRTHRRVATYEGDPKGFHENYFTYVPPEASLEKIANDMVGFLIGRIALNGAGIIENDARRNPVMRPAQKARGIQEVIGSVTTRTNQKPWVVQRHEPHSNRPDHVRFQVVGGDANVSPWATRFTFASTSIVLRLIENGIPLGHLRPVDPIKATHAIANDVHGTARVEVGSDPVRKLKAIDLLDAYLEEALKHKSYGIFSSDEMAFLSEWEETIAEYKQDRWNLADAIDHLAKDKIMQENGITQRSKRKMFDLYYDLMSGDKKGRSVVNMWRESGYFRHTLHSNDIAWAVRNAPADTRACHRGELVSALHKLPLGKGSSDSKIVNWDKVVYRSAGNWVEVVMGDPDGTLSASQEKAKQRLLRLAA